MSHRYNWSNLRRMAIRAGFVPILTLEMVSLPSVASLNKSPSNDVLIAQDACADVSSTLASAEAALSQKESEDAPDDFLRSLERSLNHANSQSSPTRDDCTRYFIDFGQYLGQELAQTELSDTYKLASIITGIRRLATFEDFSDKDRLTLVQGSLIQLNSLLVKLSGLSTIDNYLTDGASADGEIVERIQRQISVQVTALKAAEETAIQLLLLEPSSSNDSLIRETLAHLQRYGSPDGDSLELPEKLEITDAGRRVIEVSLTSLQVAALNGIEAVGYALLKCESDSPELDYSSECESVSYGGASQQLQATAPSLEEQLLQEANSKDLSLLSDLELARRVAMVRALAAVSSLQRAECSTSCSLRTLVRIIASPATESSDSNIEPLRVRAAAIAAIDKSAALNQQQFTNHVLPALRQIAEIDDTSRTISNENIAVRTQAAEIASRIVGRLHREPLLSTEGHSNGNESSGLAFADQEDGSALLVLLKQGLESDVEEVKSNAQAIFSQQYGSNLDQLTATIQQARNTNNYALLQTAVRAAGGVNYRRIEPRQGGLQTLMRELALTLSDKPSNSASENQSLIRGNAAFALGQIATFHPELFYSPNISPEASGLIAILNTLSDPTSEVVVQASYALSQYSVALNSHMKVSETLKRLGISSSPLNLAPNAQDTRKKLQACLLHILEKQTPSSEGGEGCTLANDFEPVSSEEAAVAAAFVLGQIGIEDRETVEQLIEVLRTDISDDVWESIVVYALSEISPTNADAIAPLIEFFEAPIPQALTPQTREDIEQLRRVLMEVIDVIAPEDPNTVRKFVDILNQYVFRDSSDFDYVTQVLATSAIESIASKANNSELVSESSAIKLHLRNSNSSLQQYLTNFNSSMLVCSGIAFALSEFEINANEKSFVDTLENLGLAGTRAPYCQGSENLEDFGLEEEQVIQSNLLQAGALSALGSLTPDHPKREQAIIALDSAIDLENSIEVNRAALEASKRLVLTNQGSLGTCSDLNKQSNELLPICNLLRPFQEDFVSTSSDNPESNVRLQEIRAAAFEQIQDITFDWQRGNGSEHSYLTFRNSIYPIVNTTVDLYSRENEFYLEFFQLLFTVLMSNSELLSSLDGESISNSLRLLGVQESQYTGIARACVDRSSFRAMEGESVCSTVALLVGAFGQNASTQLASDSQETEVKLFGQSLRLLTGPLATNQEPLYKTFELNEQTINAPNVQATVAFALGNMNTSYIGVDTALRELIKDPSPQVRNTAAMAISEIGSFNVLSELEKELNSPGDPESDDDSRPDTIRAISHIYQTRINDSVTMDDTLVSNFIELARSHESLDVRREALFALGYTSSADETVSDVLNQILLSPESDSQESIELRIVAAYALGELGMANSETVRALSTIIKDSEEPPEIRTSAAYAISRLWSEENPPDVGSARQAQGALTQLATSPDDRSRAMAIYALGRLATSTRSLSSRDINVSRGLSEVLSALDREELPEDLRIVATSSMRNLSSWNTPLTNRALEESSSESVFVRLNAIEVLGFLPERTNANLRNEVIATLVYILADEQEYPSIRLEACKALLGESEDDGLCAIKSEPKQDRIGILNSDERAQLTSLEEVAKSLNQLQKLAANLRAPNFFSGYRSIGGINIRSGEEVVLGFTADLEEAILYLLEIIRGSAPGGIDRVRDVSSRRGRGSDQLDATVSPCRKGCRS